ncbi:hypothetical protein FLK61_30825 [Paenalkalicoccus suaedae]|uniref:Sporulation protein YpjB n=1 Tax=Paenalkalicoccus suaedae TaxID=2592382 RepID=A0A859FE12_9BACI|nr:hypothetical protein [Paenalkalicoccus suaedae]QKS71111.1 hypothetical protein FLK61_30825 [Paenalkalicoccus suaedae]
MKFIIGFILLVSSMYPLPYTYAMQESEQDFSFLEDSAKRIVQAIDEEDYIRARESILLFENQFEEMSPKLPIQTLHILIREERALKEELSKANTGNLDKTKAYSFLLVVQAINGDQAYKEQLKLLYEDVRSSIKNSNEDINNAFKKAKARYNVTKSVFELCLSEEEFYPLKALAERYFTTPTDLHVAKQLEGHLKEIVYDQKRNEGILFVIYLVTISILSSMTYVSYKKLKVEREEKLKKPVRRRIR